MGLYIEIGPMTYIDSFDECLHLESLSVVIKHPAMFVSTVRRKFTGLAYPSPVWKLPWLRSLNLQGRTAMLFDFNPRSHACIGAPFDVRYGRLQPNPCHHGATSVGLY